MRLRTFVGRLPGATLALTLLIAACLSVLEAPRAEAASLVARIDLSEQRMRVYENGRQIATWLVSTARRGYRTPTGTFRPGRMHERYFSRKYDNAPMPHAIFFHGGYAIHGTTAIKSLGQPASHGCVRLHPDNARRLFALVKRHGKSNARIVITR